LINRIGPGEYDIKAPEIKKIAISKDVRFKIEELDNKIPLFPTDNLTKSIYLKISYNFRKSAPVHIIKE